MFGGVVLEARIQDSTDPIVDAWGAESELGRIGLEVWESAGEYWNTSGAMEEILEATLLHIIGRAVLEVCTRPELAAAVLVEPYVEPPEVESDQCVSNLRFWVHSVFEQRRGSYPLDYLRNDMAFYWGADSPLIQNVMELAFDAYDEWWSSGQTAAFEMIDEPVIELCTDPAVRMIVAGEVATAEEDAGPAPWGETTADPSFLAMADLVRSDPLLADCRTVLAVTLDGFELEEWSEIALPLGLQGGTYTDGSGGQITVAVGELGTSEWMDYWIPPPAIELGPIWFDEGLATGSTLYELRYVRVDVAPDESCVWNFIVEDRCSDDDCPFADGIDPHYSFEFLRDVVFSLLAVE